MTSRPRLRILFATTHPHLPQIAGGLQASTDETIRRLRARGHDARLLCGLTGEGLLGMRHRLFLKLSGIPVVQDRTSGYTVYRAWYPACPAAVAHVAREFAPDAVVAQGGGVAPLVRAFDTVGVPGLIHHRLRHPMGAKDRDRTGGHLIQMIDKNCALGAQVGHALGVVLVHAGAVGLHGLFRGVQEVLLVSGAELVEHALVHQEDGGRIHIDRKSVV